MEKNEKARALAGKNRYTFSELCDITEILRAPGGCPWDMEQTHKSTRRALLEECYEVVEAIDLDDKKLMREELGDLLFQVLFHAQIEKELGNFDIDDVSSDIAYKLVSRHPHVFSRVDVDSVDEVLVNWDKIKNEEKKRQTATSRLRAIPSVFPALMQAQSVGERAAKVGFDFSTAEEAEKKIYEELSEIKEADADSLKEECGDLLFAVVNYLRKLGIDAEEALHNANEKFISRFDMLEQISLENGKRVEENSIEDLDKYWNMVKLNKKQ